jgi:surface protein
MLYPILVDTASPIFGKLDYSKYEGTNLAWTFAYTNSSEVDRVLPTDVLKQTTNTYNINYESDFIVHNPLEVAKYTCSTSGVLPTFNSSFKGYTANEVDNKNGTYTTSIMSNNVDNMPTSISFRGLTSLLTIQNVNVSNITNMESMFRDCKNLTSLDVSNWDTSRVTNMWYMFYGCEKITKLDLSNLDTSRVTTMNGMFYNCWALTQLDVSFDVSKVTDLNNFLPYRSYTLVDFNPPRNISTDFSIANSYSLSSTSVSKVVENLAYAKKTLRVSLNQYEKLTSEEVKSATDKGWTITIG